jgi:ABC-2 type transport system permease protein
VPFGRVPFGLERSSSLRRLLPSSPRSAHDGRGLFLGTAVDRQAVGGIFPIIIHAATLMSGTWFDLKLIGGWFASVSYALPFAHAVDAARRALQGDFQGALPHMGRVLLYAAAVYALAVWLFRRKMRQ